MKELVGQVLTGGPWSLAIYGKGHIFPDNGPFSFERVPVFKFQLCPDPLVLCVCVCVCVCVGRVGGARL